MLKTFSALLIAGLCCPIVAVAQTAPVVVKGGEAVTALSRPSVERGTQSGAAFKNLELLKSKDGQMFSGLYESGPSEFKAEPYPVDEFMYFLEGSVTLTSEDGAVTTVSAGDALTLPKGWRGVWKSTAYRKFYTIYVLDKPEPAR